MILFTENIDVACTIAVAYGALVHRGQLVRPADLEERREEILDSVRKIGLIPFSFQSEESIIVWAVGDLARLSAPSSYGEAYENQKNAGLPFFPEALRFEPVPEKSQYAETLKELFCDPSQRKIYHISSGPVSDRIFLYMYCYSGCNTPFIRLEPKSLSRDDLTEAISMQNEDASMCWFFSELARTMLYWSSRTNLSRIASQAFEKPMDLKVKTLPALSLLYERSKKVKPKEKYTEYIISLQLTTETGEKFTADPASKKTCRFQSEQEAKLWLDKTPDQAVTDKITVETETIWPEGPLNLQGVMDEAARSYYYTPEQTTDLLTRLYHGGYISNPNTLGRTYPEGQQELIRSNLMQLASTKTYGELFHAHRFQNISRILFSEETPGIYITDRLPDRLCDQDQRNVYKVITKQLLKTMLPPKKVRKTKINVLFGGMLYTSNYTEVLEPGFSVLDDPIAKKKVPPAGLEEGSMLHAEPYLKTSDGTPPQPFTKSQFITELTRLHRKLKVRFATQQEAETIATSIIRDQLAVMQGKNILISHKGSLFIQSLAGIETLLNTATVLNWELTLKKITEQETPAQAAALSNAFLENAQDTITSWCQMLVESAGKPSVVPCPVCGRRMYHTSESYFCRSCGYRIATQLFGRPMEEMIMGYLCQHKKTPLIHGFKVQEKCVWGRLILTDTMQVSLSLDSDYLCPACSKPLRLADDGSEFTCSANCGFRLPRVVFGHKLKKDELTDILSKKRRTSLISSLRASGGVFAGYFVLNEQNELKCVVVEKEES